MPTYEYRCTECGERTEAFQRMSDAALTTCPSCQKEALQRVVSGGAGVLYKGEGWYVTDYSKKSSGGKEPSPTPSSASTSTTGSSESGAAPSAAPANPPAPSSATSTTKDTSSSSTKSS